MNYDDILTERECLEHWGILGMKWGVRRYQNKDGSLTSAGRARYGTRTSYKQKNSMTESEIKAKIIKKPTAKDLKEYRHLFTTQELKDIAEREKAIASVVSSTKIEKSERQETYSRFEKLMGSTGNLLKSTAVIAGAVIVGSKIVKSLKNKGALDEKMSNVEKLLKEI